MTQAPDISTGTISEKPTTSTVPRAELQRTLGTGSIVFMVVAAAAPLTVIAGTVPLLMALGNGIGAPADYAIAAVILLLFAVGYATMTRYVKNAGAFYAYVQAGLGRVTGMGAAFLALVSYAILLIAVLAYIGAATANVIATYTGADTPWWLWAGVVFLIVGYLGYRNIELSSKVLGVALIAEVGIVALLDALILARGGETGLDLVSFTPDAVLSGSPGIGLMFALFGFIGFEATAVFRNEAKDPDVTIPRATYIAVIVIGAFYSFSAWAVVQGAGSANALAVATEDPEGMVLAQAGRYIGSVAHDVMQVLLVTSLFACVLAFHTVLTRYGFTLGSVGALPAKLGIVSAKHSSPSFSSLVTSVLSGAFLLVVALIGLDPVVQVYAWFSGAATLGLVALMALTSVAVIVFFRTTAHDKRPWPTLIAPVLSLLGLAVALVLIVTNLPLLIGDAFTAIVMTLVLAVSVVVGVTVALRMKRKRSERYEQLRTLVG